MQNLLKIYLLGMLLVLNTSAQIPVWIDYDISYGKMIRDVDDGLALITALQSNKLDIKGISYGFGNISNHKYMHKKTHKILKKLKRLEINVFPGAKEKEDLFKVTEATLALYKALSKEKIVIMAMGRLTNVASLIKNFPEIKGHIKEVIINAGRMLEYETKVGKQQVIMPDTNIDDHLEAMRYVLESGVKITMIPTEIMHDKFVTREHLKQMRKGSKLSRWMANNSFVWRWIWKFFPNSKGFIPWDVFIVTYLTEPQEMNCHIDIPIDLTYLKNNTSSLFRKKYKKPYKYFLTASWNVFSQYRGNYCYEMTDDHLDKIINSWIKY